MAQTSFGSFAERSGHTDGYVNSPGIPLPGGNTMFNGSGQCIITALYGGVSGYGGARTVYMSLGPSQTAAFNVGTAGQANDSGWRSSGPWLVWGGTSTFQITTTNGQFYFARGGGGSNVNSPFGTFSGTLGGAYSFVQAPTAINNLNAYPSGTVSGAIVLNWNFPPSDGETPITSFDVYYSNGTYIGNTNQLAYAVFGLTPGQSYGFTVRSRNWVTDAAGTTSVNSNVATVTAPGLPGAPTSLSAVSSTTALNSINLTWTAPALTGGTLTAYNIYSNSALIATVSGSTTSYLAVGASNTSYTFTVAARNSFSDANGTTGPLSNSSEATAPGVPTAPLSLVATADNLIPGRISLEWATPVTGGVGGVTAYDIYRSTAELYGTTASTTFDVDNLIPGVTYTFYVKARNAIATATGTASVASNNASAMSSGDPGIVSGLVVAPSSAVAGRLTLTWQPPLGPRTGYSVFTSAGVLVSKPVLEQYNIDGLIPGNTYTYYIRTRNSITDAAGSDGGPASANASGVPRDTTSQSVSGVSVTDTTNTALGGTYTISSTTSTTVSYAKTAANVSSRAVPGGTIANNTNTTLNGTYTVTAPTATTLTYAKTASNIPANTVASGGTLTDNTNAIFNGAFIVTSADSANKKVSYAKTNANISTRAASGAITNATNVTFNGSNLTITDTTSNTISYAKVNADVAEISATGTITDKTNVDIFNGTYTVTGTPAYNKFSYQRLATLLFAVTTNRVTNPAGVTTSGTATTPYGAMPAVVSFTTEAVAYAWQSNVRTYTGSFSVAVEWESAPPPPPPITIRYPSPLEYPAPDLYPMGP